MSSLSKVIGQELLTFKELEEVLLDIECFINSRRLFYQGEEFEKPVFAANLLVKGQLANFLDEDVEELDEKTAVTKELGT